MQIHIQIKLKGTEFPDPDELLVRDRLEELLIEKQIGEIFDIGAGEGVMDIFLEVDDYKSSLKKINAVVKQLNIENITTIIKLKKQTKKKLNYKVGDIVKVPLKEKEHFGYGHILTEESREIFVKFYRIVTEKENLEIETFKDLDWILKIYCSDLGITRFKTWKVIGNIPVEKNISLPMFWHKNPLTGKLYLREDPFDSTSQKETTEEEIKQIRAQPAISAGSEAAEIRLTYELKKAGLL
jgi:hypothetical protein